MSHEAIEKYFIHNEKIVDTDSFGGIKPEGAVIYEVIRVIAGVPLFLERHLERLLTSAAAIGFNIGHIVPDIKSGIKRLIEANASPDKNVKLIVFSNNNRYEYMLFFIKSNYPTANQYAEGVETITYKAERSNPNAKVINQSLRDKIEAAIKEKNAYEAILVSDAGNVTEGSRSNLFLVKGDSIYTAPGASVLIGITRIHIFDICTALGIKLVEEPLSQELLYSADAVFLTGTSPKVLPIAKVDEMHNASSTNALVAKIVEAYDKAIVNYIKINS